MSKLKFTDIPNRLRYKSEYKGVLSSYHSDVIDYVTKHFQDKRRYKISVIQLMNQISYLVYSGDSFPTGWPNSNPFEPKSFWNSIDVNDQTKSIKDIFINYQDVEWNIEPVEFLQEPHPSSESTRQHKSEFSYKKVTKEDLSIQPPIYPRFDYNQIYKQGVVDNINYVIYKSLPEIPKVQRDISVTTDLSRMTEKDLLNLFPNTRILTRYSSLYSYVEDIKYDNILGCIIPISQFTEEQIRQNIIQYPHFFKLKRQVDGQIVSFYNTIEIDGELYKVLDIWDDLPESKVIPKQHEFIKDYVVRRYLLERDILGVEHKYPLYGTLDPFLTLFTTPEDYADLGYENSLDLAVKCVKSRISYKESRNPILRRLNDV